MNMQDKTELASINANECDSKFDEIAPKPTQHRPIDFLIVTRIPQKSYKFHWIIRQFSTISKNKALCSSVIHSSTSGHQLKLVRYEHGFGLFHVRESTEQSSKTRTERNNASRIGGGGIFGTYTVVSEESEEDENKNEFSIMLEYEISATDIKGNELMKWSASFSDGNESLNYKIGEYINNTMKYFPDDSLILDCNLKVILMPTTEEIPISYKPSLECNGWKKLSIDLKSLYQNSLDTDITLVVGTDKIRAHKLILIARSTVFKKIFHHDMKESEQNSVIITDVPFSALKRLVEFLYTGVIAEGENKDMDLQELLDLYYAADKYEVVDLREMVGNTLLGRAEMDNATEILVWADRHNDKDLKFRIMNFIRQNFDVVSNSDEWESCAFHQPRLAVEVFSFCVKKTQMP